MVPTFEWAIKLATDVICLFLSKYCELLTACREVQICHCLIELLRQEVDLSWTTHPRFITIGENCLILSKDHELLLVICSIFVAVTSGKDVVDWLQVTLDSSRVCMKVSLSEM